MQYVQDYDERYPTGYVYVNATTAYAWSYWVTPYVKNQGVFKCPSDPLINPNTTTLRPSAYGYHTRLFSPSPATTINMAQLAAPADTIIICDQAEVTAASMNFPAEQWVRGGNGDWDVRFPRYGAMPGTVEPNYSNPAVYNRRRPFPRHMEGASFAFADGHVKWLKVQAVVSTPYGSATCYYDNF